LITSYLSANPLSLMLLKLQIDRASDVMNGLWYTNNLLNGYGLQTNMTVPIAITTIRAAFQMVGTDGELSPDVGSALHSGFSSA